VKKYITVQNVSQARSGECSLHVLLDPLWGPLAMPVVAVIGHWCTNLRLLLNRFTCDIVIMPNKCLLANTFVVLNVVSKHGAT